MSYIIYPNRRLQKSRHLTAHIMHMLHSKLPASTNFKEIARELEDLFYTSGVEIITEADRIAAGLQPRDHNGLTIDELRAIDAVYLNNLLKPLPPIMNEDGLNNNEN